VRPRAERVDWRVSAFTWFLALKHVRRRALQSALTVAGVAVGVMVLIVALSLTNGFIAQLVSSTLQATPHVTLSGFTGEPFPLEGGVTAALLEHPEVVAVAPFLETQALIVRRADALRGVSARQGFTQILGVDPAAEAAVLPDLPVLREHAELLAETDGLLLGASLSRSLGVYSGDTVLIQNVSRPRRSFVVADSFRVGNEFIDNLVSFAPLSVLQEYLNAPGQVTGFHVRVQDPERATLVAAQLAQASGLLAQSWQQLFGTLLEQLQLQKALIAVVVFLIVLVAAMGIANILILTVAEKTEEIAILRAMGAPRGQILSVFLAEGLLLGGVGTLLGVLMGLGVSLYFRLQPFPLPGELYFISRLPVELQLFDVLWVSALSLGTAVVAALIPARRASGLNPVEIIR
jgi:lipoprotein-releasing system permease protein